MLKTWMTLLIATFLIVVGFLTAIYKYSNLSFPLFQDDNFSSWYVELVLSVNANSSKSYRVLRSKKLPLKISVIRPQENSNYAVTNLNFLSPDFGKTRTKTETQRYYRFTKRNPGYSESILMRFNLYELDVNETNSKKPKVVGAKYYKRNRISNPDESLQLLYKEIDIVSSKANELSSSPISFAEQLISILRKEDETLSFLIENTKSKDETSLLVKLLRANKVAAKAANGFSLINGVSEVELHRWLEVYSEGRWQRISFNGSKATGELKNYYRWWYGDDDIVNAPDLKNIKISISTKANNDSAFTRALWISQKENTIAHLIALQTLPLKQQMVIQILLLLPLGALIVSFFRQVVGVPTFGTFMPVLIAIAFRETGLAYGLVFFFTIVMVGLIARNYIDRLRLLMVPRLSAILTVVIILIICFMLVNKNGVIPLGISIALFPVVIITMFIERMSTVLDEQGYKTAFSGFLGSLIVACIIYLLVVNEQVKHILFTFPELLFVILGLCMILGRYNGYRLSEFWRFRNLMKEKG